MAGPSPPWHPAIPLFAQGKARAQAKERHCDADRYPRYSTVEGSCLKRRQIRVLRRLDDTRRDLRWLSHSDRVHYAVTGLGEWTTQGAFSDADRARDAKAEWLENGHPQKQKWKDFSVCTLASAAFPVDLAPRQIYAHAAEYAGRNNVSAVPR